MNILKKAFNIVIRGLRIASIMTITSITPSAQGSEMSDFMGMLQSSASSSSSSNNPHAMARKKFRTQIQTISDIKFNESSRTNFHELSINQKIKENDDAFKTLSFGTRVSDFKIFSNNQFEKSSPQIKGNYNNVSLNQSFVDNVNSEMNFGESISVGSPSDKPFANNDVISVHANLFFTYKPETSEKGLWIFMLNYSNTRYLLKNIPLPGFAYSYSYSKELNFLIGAPFIGIFAMPFEKAMFTAFYLPTKFFNFRFSYFALGPIQVYTTWDSSHKSYIPSDRGESNNVLYFEDMRANIGLRTPITKNISIDLGYGKAFQRNITWGKSISRFDNRINIPRSGNLYFESKINF